MFNQILVALKFGPASIHALKKALDLAQANNAKLLIFHALDYTYQNADENDPGLYDLVINTEKIGPASAAKLIVETACCDEMKECSLGALVAMERLSMERKIQAALLKNDINPKMIYFEVTETGVALLRGISSAQQMKDRIISVVKEVPGIQDVKSDISVINRDYT